MNFCYIFTILCAIIILALVFVGSIEAYVGGRVGSKTKNGQLNVFHKAINEAKQDLNTIVDFNGQIDKNLLRQRRQTIDEMLNSFQIDSNNEALEDNENETMSNDEVDYSRNNDQGPDNGLRQLRAKEYRRENDNKQRIAEEDLREMVSWNEERFNSNPPLSEYKSFKNFLDHENSENICANSECACSANDKRCHGGNSEETREKGVEKGDKENGKILKHKYSGRNQEEYKRSSDSKDFVKNVHNPNDYRDHNFSNRKHCQHEVNSNINQNKHQQNIKPVMNSLNNRGFSETSLNNARCSSKSKDLMDNNNRYPNFYYRDSSKPLNEETLNYLSQHYMNFDLPNSTQSALKEKNVKDKEEEDELYAFKYPVGILRGTDSDSASENYQFSSTENYNLVFNIPFDNIPETNDQNLDTSLWNLDAKQISPPYNDQFEKAKNNLSHEANYKLSKMEQDDSEKKKDFIWKWGNFKRSADFNPMNEIKLKTSSRLMKKGFGPSLPSYSLGETRREIMIDNMLKRKEQKLLKMENKYDFNGLNPLYEKPNEEVIDRDKRLEDFENEPLNPVLMPMETNNWNYMRRKRIIDNSRTNRKGKEKNTETKESSKGGKEIVEKELKNISRQESKKNKFLSSDQEISNKGLEEFIKALQPFKAEEGNIYAQKDEDKSQDHSDSLNKANLESNKLEEASEDKLGKVQANLKPKSKLRKGNINFYRKPLEIETDQVRMKDKNLHRRRKRSLDKEESQKNVVNYHQSNNLFFKDMDKFESDEFKPLKILKRVKRLHPIDALNLKIYQRFHSPEALKFNKLKRFKTRKSINKNKVQTQTNNKRNRYKRSREKKFESQEKIHKTLNKRETREREKKKSESTKKRITKEMKQNEKIIANSPLEKEILEIFKSLKQSSKKSRSKREIVSNSENVLKALNRRDLFINRNSSISQEKNITPTEYESKTERYEKFDNFLLNFIQKLLRKAIDIFQSIKAYTRSLTTKAKLYKLTNNITQISIENNSQNSTGSENLQENIDLVKSSNFKEPILKSPLKINLLQEELRPNTDIELYLNNDLSKKISCNKSSHKNSNKLKKLPILNISKSSNNFVVKEIPKNREKRSLVERDKVAEKLGFHKSSMKENQTVTSLFKILQQQTPFVSSSLNENFKLKLSSDENYKDKSLLKEKFNMAQKLRSNISSQKGEKIMNSNIKEQLEKIILKEYILSLKSFLTQELNKKHIKNSRNKFENDLKYSKQIVDNSNSHSHKHSANETLKKSTNKKNLESSKSRQKRSIALDIMPDFDNIKLNEDELLSRLKRSSRNKHYVNSNPKENLLKSNLIKHRIKKRYANSFEDLYQPNYDLNFMSNNLQKNSQKEDTLDSNMELDFNNSNRGLKYPKEASDLGFLNLKRNNYFPIYDYENVPRALTAEYDNLKQNIPDKLKSSKTIQNSGQIQHNSKQAKARFESPLNYIKLNSNYDARWRKNINKRQNFKSKVKSNSNSKVIQSKQKYNHKTQDLQSSKSVETLKDNYLNDLKNFNKNYKFNDNNFNVNNPYFRNWLNSLDNYNISLEDSTTESTKQQDENQITSSNDSTKISLALHNEILNCTAFQNLQDFLNSIPKNITEGISGVNTKPSQPENPTTDKIDIEFSTSDLNEFTTTSTTTTTCIPATKLPTTTETSQEIQSISTTLESITELPNLEKSTPIEYPDITEANPELSTQNENEWPTEEDESTTEFLFESTSFTESILETLPTESTTFSADSENDVKLNITINANVHTNPKAKNFYGNGTLNVMPGFSDDRIRRDILLPPFEELQKRRCAQKPTASSNLFLEDNEGINSLASEKLSANVVKSIFNTVQENPQLKTLWPSLRRNQLKEKPVLQNLYAIRNQENKHAIHQTEKLLKKAMESINDIIEEQVRSHACVPLRPDLQEFYDLILQTRKEQEKCRDKRQTASIQNLEDFSKEVRLMDPNKVEEESRIVKKLLKQYEELPENDQKQVAAVKDDLLTDLLLLRKLRDVEERHENDIREKKELQLDENDEEVIKSLETKYTPQFLKLLKAAELYREITSEPEEPVF